MITKECPSCGRIILAGENCNCWESNLEIKKFAKPSKSEGGEK